MNKKLVIGVVAVLGLVFIGWLLNNVWKAKFIVLTSQTDTVPLNTQVEECVREERAQGTTGDLEGRCILSVAARLYASDSNAALAFCQRKTLVIGESEAEGEERCRGEIEAYLRVGGSVEATETPETITTKTEIELSDEQRTAWTRCMGRDGEPRVELSMEGGEDEVFCSFGDRGECTQGELNRGECNVR